ncbi:SGNH/GDSL hydrolase family protein [Sphingomonas jatrophae]|uniref:Lysophospholipase L1 n=1 Tax=Sphingomonas jatrophae TaxID=1166337 RepID=A0A1I6K637_9SPHN|nr:SGNH/GDSL hydrolase family protein [Sphingomonas jatrophae]SFR86699.1 hypothetical protein SAMN05192580_1368 [Sphingomonas jatrophae]
MHALARLIAALLLAVLAVTPAAAQDIPARGLAAKARDYALTGTTALGHIKWQLLQGRDASILVDSDSTGNSASAPREMPFRLADEYARLFPAATIIVNTWNTTTSTYTDQTIVQSGSGPTLTIQNFAVPGAALFYAMGSFWTGASQLAWVTPDAVIFNHGHNHVVGTTIEMVRGELLAGVEMWRLFHPGVPIAIVTQNPRYGDDFMATAYAAWRDVARLRPDVEVIDSYALWIAAGKPASWYLDAVGDGIHPADPGFVGAMVPAVRGELAVAPARPARGAVSLFEPSAASQNLLLNGGFELWPTSPGLPTNWLSSGTITAEKDTSIYRNQRLGYSLKLTASTAGAYIYQDIPAFASLRGKPVTLTVWLYRPTGSTAGAARVAVTAPAPSGGTVTITTRANAPISANLNGWQPWVISGLMVPANASSLRVVIYQDSGTPSANPVYFDQVVLTPGYLPKAISRLDLPRLPANGVGAKQMAA